MNRREMKAPNFAMKSDTPAVVHRPKRELPHLAAEVRDDYPEHADSLVRDLRPWAREIALGYGAAA